MLASPFAILRIEDKDGNIIEDFSPNNKEALSKETAYLMTDLLKGGVNGGTGKQVRSPSTADPVQAKPEQPTILLMHGSSVLPRSW